MGSRAPQPHPRIGRVPQRSACTTSRRTYTLSKFGWGVQGRPHHHRPRLRTLLQRRLRRGHLHPSRIWQARASTSRRFRTPLPTSGTMPMYVAEVAGQINFSPAYSSRAATRRSRYATRTATLIAQRIPPRPVSSSATHLRRRRVTPRSSSPPSTSTARARTWTTPRTTQTA